MAIEEAVEILQPFSCQFYKVKVRPIDLPGPARLFQLEFSRAGACLQGSGNFHRALSLLLV